MSDYTELVQVIKRAAVDAVEQGKPCDILFGTVQKVKPLQIFVEMGMVLEQDELVLAQHLKDYSTELSFDDPQIKQVFTTWDMEEKQESAPAKMSLKQQKRHKVTIYNGLRTGDKVILLRKQSGQRFLVLDRVVVDE